MKPTATFLLLALLATAVPARADSPAIPSAQRAAHDKLKDLEASFGGRIGVYALNTADGEQIQYRADTLFPVQSTMKFIAAAALFDWSSRNKTSLQEKVRYGKDDLVDWHPVTGSRLGEGMTLEDLAAAAVTHSDNPATNLITRRIGGPDAVTRYARSIGNMSLRVDSWEPHMNSNPDVARDVATPKDMALSAKTLLLDGRLQQGPRTTLLGWMKDSTTGARKMRAGAALGWTVADKTGGGGDFGVANDVGILWSPACKPIVLAIYTVQGKQAAKPRDDVVATATSLVMESFKVRNPCFGATFH